MSTEIEEIEDIVSELVEQNGDNTTYLRVRGDVMQVVGIYNDSIVVVDSSLEPKNMDVVLAEVDGEMVIKRFHQGKNGMVTLLPDNPNYESVEITQDSDFQLKGVITRTINTIFASR
ncbi:MAG: S24 family peptidase [Lentisphaeria bacterium]|nr:S24 family peptidase [Lentisphaeria bacterium]NQZ68098.1 S24 family peptidase [Lentisphaeria bacterium]